MLTDFISEQKLALGVEPNPRAQSGEWPEGTRHYVVTLSRPGVDAVRLPYFFAAEHEGEPTLELVLSDLRRSIGAVRAAGGLEAWASMLGTTPESPRARRAFYRIMRGRLALESLLGFEACERLLWEAE